jgi:hypothetical protein
VAGRQLACLDPIADVCSNAQIDPRVLVIHGNDGS